MAVRSLDIPGTAGSALLLFLGHEKASLDETTERLDERGDVVGSGVLELREAEAAPLRGLHEPRLLGSDLLAESGVAAAKDEDDGGRCRQLEVRILVGPVLQRMDREERLRRAHDSRALVRRETQRGDGFRTHRPELRPGDRLRVSRDEGFDERALQRSQIGQERQLERQWVTPQPARETAPGLPEVV